MNGLEAMMRFYYKGYTFIWDNMRFQIGSAQCYKRLLEFYNATPEAPPRLPSDGAEHVFVLPEILFGFEQENKAPDDSAPVTFYLYTQKHKSRLWQFKHVLVFCSPFLAGPLLYFLRDLAYVCILFDFWQAVLTAHKTFKQISVFLDKRHQTLLQISDQNIFIWSYLLWG